MENRLSEINEDVKRLKEKYDRHELTILKNKLFGEDLENWKREMVFLGLAEARDMNEVAQTLKMLK